MARLGLVNQQTLICENITLDDRPVSEIQLDGYIVLDLMQTMAYRWDWNGQEWVKREIGFNQGCIGFLYESGSLVEPKPEDPIQPVSGGTQEI